jgi:muramoyltetrapeptide carboxypeptidase
MTLRDPNRSLAASNGKGSYRIADRLDFAAARRDAKFVVGFSDITILHLSLWKHCRLIGVHGSLVPDEQGCDSLRRVLMTSENMRLRLLSSLSSNKRKRQIVPPPEDAQD